MNKGKRNSSIEVLRILSMLMIISHHFIILSQVKTLEQPITVNKVFADLILRPGGKIGVTIFFLISAYFICKETQDIKRNFKRIIILDGEMLFWGILITGFFVFFNRKFVSVGSVIHSFIPLISRMWWYPTSYAVFLLLAPFITMSLKYIGKSMHFNLVLILIVCWGLIAGLLPNIYLDISSQNMIIFCYLYILVTYYVWYLKPLSRKIALMLIGIGMFLIWANIIICSYLYQKTGSVLFINIEDSFISHEWKLPVIFAAFGLFSFFISFQCYSKAINAIAKCTFGVFLIHNHPISSKFLSVTIFDMREQYYSSYYPIIAITLIVFVYIMCTVADLIRQQIFRFTIDNYIDRIFIVILRILSSMKVFIEKQIYPYER